MDTANGVTKQAADIVLLSKDLAYVLSSEMEEHSFFRANNL